MNRTTSRWILALILVAGALSYQNCAKMKTLPGPDFNEGSSVGGDHEHPPVLEKLFITHGEFASFAAAAPKVIGGRAMMVRSNLGYTDVYVDVTGLDPNTPHVAHVHARNCATDAGGGHYKIDPGVATAVETNELWPQFTTNANGVGSIRQRFNHVARAEGQSIVIHQPNATPAPKWACADLLPESSNTFVSGRLVELPDAAVAETIVGSAILLRKGKGQTVVRLSVAGLIPNTMYMSHVHDSACSAVPAGGAHYKINPVLTTVLTPAETASNEIWLNFTSSATGDFSGLVASNGHIARMPSTVGPLGAASLVIHAMVGATAPRVACLDFAPGGGFVSNAVALQRVPPVVITGAASMYRSDDGKTKVSASAEGLLPNKSYTLHVHNEPCNSNGGGGHYKIDTSVLTAVESNEMWVRFTTDATGKGAGSVTVNHLARPDAQSVVLHDPDVPADRLACTLLY